MCGITGYINLNNKPIKDTSRIIQMLKVQKHRGPDDSGIRAFSLRSGQSKELVTNVPQSIEGNFEGVLGFNRLSILDLSLNGHQPMVSPDEKVILALNGEIYNAFDYKPELKEWGYRFRSTADTEVVLALYLRYGFEGMLDRLNGMFAIVIVDLGKNEILITRDRFGIKPMYYVVTGYTLAFSSELKSFGYLEGFRFQLDETQLDEFLLFRNNIKGTLFKDIQTLDPGHYLSYSHDTGFFVKRYFDINHYDRTRKEPGDLDYYGEKLVEWLGRSVQSQLMSDVKLGCQLSGGIDSSLVTWLANRNSEKGNFEAVSIIFNDSRFSEEQYIDRVSKQLSITSHKFLLESDYYFDNLERATWHLEVPINHPNTIGIYKLSQRAKEYVTVLLSGEGADEVFGGYGRFYDIGYPFRTRKMLHEIKKNLIHPFRMKDYFDHEYRAVMATVFMTPFMAGNLLDGFNEERAISGRKDLYRILSGSLFDRQVKYEMHAYLPDLLIRQDKMSMAHSIENRVPFLDNEVVENAFSIPEKYLLIRKSPEGRNNEKYLLKKIIADTFGRDFAFRDKMGFGIPLKEFFLNKSFAEYLNDSILPGIRERKLFTDKLVLSWLADLQNLRYNEMEALWVVASFEIWAGVYLDNNYENRDTSY
ncbi:MAG: asparagine synthase (glutamine-hydrolyzing) [Bacteroidales bacterium]|nr:asparagine synthase (glutamine-hydrolyzing) [Bacteroidales bacterium]